MSALRSHTRQAGLLSNLLAYALLALPLPTHAYTAQALDRPSIQRAHSASCSAACLGAATDARPSRPN